MTAVEMRGITQSFAGQLVLSNLDLQVSTGQYAVLLGPSGCGKTTLLRIVAGLQSADRGTVLFDGQTVSHVKPRERDVSMVFQTDGLYPHLTIRDSLRFALPRQLHPNQIESRIKEAATLARVTSILDRYPNRLSGGELRRCGVAKAIARRASVRLLDEPLSALDTPLRYQLQEDLLSWHRQHPGTTLHVTHDGEEAMRMADRIAVFETRAIAQWSSPHEIYSNPVSIDVARAVGSPPINLIPCLVDGKEIRPRDRGIALTLDHQSQISGREITLGIRPDAIRLDSHFEQTHDDEIRLAANLVELRCVEGFIQVHLAGNTEKLVAVVRECDAPAMPSIGGSVRCTVHRKDVYTFESDSGRRIEMRHV